MNKPTKTKRIYHNGMPYVPEVDFELMRIYAESMELKLAMQDRHHRGKAVRHDGKTYPSLTALAKANNSKPQTLRYYIKHKKPFGNSLIVFEE